MSKQETKTCQNCKSDFVIESEDFEFYEKIQVPAPTFCPDCRNQRRLAFRNEWYLYKRKDDLTGNDIVSLHPYDSSFPVYNYKDWRSQEKWDPMDYGKDYDFSRPFLEQFKELIQKVPRYNVFSEMSVGCEYCGLTYNSKNCYLSLASDSENCAYLIGHGAKNCFDSVIVEGENCYETVDCDHSYNILFSQDSNNCMDSAFLFDCHNCQSCFFSVALRNKKYHIFNEPYAKKEYREKIKQYRLGSFESLTKIKEEFENFKLKFPRRFARIFKSVNCTGDNIGNSKNCQYCFFTRYGVEDGKYIFGGGLNLKDSYDSYDSGRNAELIYEGHGAGGSGEAGGSKIFFSRHIIAGRNIYYSDECFNCHDIFGCAGLKNKSYCILNKQYTEEEYEKMLPEIMKHMNDTPYVDKKSRVYRFGEFFPTEFSPFGYNESSSQEFFPLSKEAVAEAGFNYRDVAKYQNEHKSTVKAGDLVDDVGDVKDSIINEIIECQNKEVGCAGSGVFRIIPMEFEFLKKYNIALPRECPQCRRIKRVQKRNPLKLWHRKCQCAGLRSENKIYQNTTEHFHKKEHCPNEFETPYLPGRKEIIYCENCYQKEFV